jgi:hypothetical protein
VITRQDIERLRARAARYGREAEKAPLRAQFFYCRALARHLEREADELERLIESDAPLGEPRRNASGELDPLDGSGELQLETHVGNQAENVVVAPVFWRRPGIRRGYQWRASTSSKAHQS